MKSSLRHKDRRNLNPRIIVQAIAKSQTKDETKKNSYCFIFASPRGGIMLCFRIDFVLMLMLLAWTRLYLDHRYFAMNNQAVVFLKSDHQRKTNSIALPSNYVS